MSLSTALGATEFALASVLAWQLAGIFWLLNPPPAPAQPPRLAVAERDAATPDPAARSTSGPALTALKGLFGETRNDAPIDIAEPVRETPLQLALKGIIGHRATGVHFALIAREGQKEKVYALGESVAGAEIVAIQARRVILRRNGVNESLSLQVERLERVADENRSDRRVARFGIRRDGNNARVVPAATFREQIEDLPRLVQQARAIPYEQNGEQVGLQVVHIEQGSVFHELGIRPRDIIRSVNGAPVRTPREAVEAYNEFKSAGNYSINVMRDGAEMVLNYLIEP